MVTMGTRTRLSVTFIRPLPVLFNLAVRKNTCVFTEGIFVNIDTKYGFTKHTAQIYFV
jgi:hypothetical protein